jgi:hypothetical protein
MPLGPPQIPQDLGWNLGHRCGKPATNGLSYRTADSFQVNRVSKWVTNGYKTWNMCYSNLEEETHLFLNISSTNNDTLALSVRRNPQHTSLLTVVSPTSAPPCQSLPSSAKRLSPSWNRFTRQTLPTVNRKYFFVNILCIESFCPQKTHDRTLQAQSPLWLLKPASEHAQARLLSRLSRSWTVLLPSDAYRNPITSITAVLLPLVAYLLTLPLTSAFAWRFCVYREDTSVRIVDVQAEIRTGYLQPEA